MRRFVKSSPTLRTLVALMLCSLVGTGIATTYPTWWSNRGVIKPNAAADDYAAINRGQLKNIALGAFKECETRLPGGAGLELTQFIDTFTQVVNGQREPKTSAQTDDFAVATIGQVKAMALPFYQRFTQLGFGARFIWPASGSADDYAVANLGQAKSIFNFELDPTALVAAPDPLGWTSGPGSSIVITWPRIPEANGYRLERKLPFGNGTSSEWAVLAALGGGVSSFTDSIVVLDQIYAYRVIAVRGLAESLPSGELWLKFNGPSVPPSIPDSDGNGTPDSDETPGNVDNDATDNAHDTDDDNDGTLDQYDRWPDDPRRSEEIPLKFYGVMDLAANGSSVPTANIKSMAIDDSGNVAWMIQDGDTKVVTWSDGAVQSVATYELGGAIGVNGINASGQIAGAHTTLGESALERTIEAMPDHRGVPGSYVGEFEEDNSEFADSNLEISFVNNGITNGGMRFGTIKFVTGNHDDASTWQQQQVHVRYEDSSGQIEEAPTTGDVGIASRNGTAVLTKPGPTEEIEEGMIVQTAEIGTSSLWGLSGGAPLIGTVRPYAINDQGWVAGTQKYWVRNPTTGEQEAMFVETSGDNPRGELGFVWTPTDGKITFHDWLPDKFKKQFRDAVPQFITNVDPATNAPKIVFYGSYLTGPKGQEIWTTGLFIWWKDTDGNPQIVSVAFPSGQGFEGMAINNHLAFVGTSASTGGPRLAFPVSFWSKDIEKGFDPPMAGDVHVEYQYNPVTKRYVELSRVRDEDNPEWWTSVCSVSVAGAAGIVGDLNVNNHIEVVFENDAQAGLCEIIPTPASREFIDVIDNGMVTRTALTITGKASAGTERQNAEICVYPKSGVEGAQGQRQAKPGVLPLAKLKVMVMPKINLKLAVWKIPSDPLNPTASIPAVVNPAAILQETNRAFRQACVVFTAVPAPSVVSSAYDSRQPFNYLNTEPMPGSQSEEYDETFKLETDVKNHAVTNSGLAEVNLAIVRSITAESAFALHVTRIDAQMSFISASRPARGPVSSLDFGLFCLECAHEIGHQLRLSTRRTGPTIPENHDIGIFPYPKHPQSDNEYLGTGLLMPGEKSPQSKVWLRHEDWVAAWKSAQALVGKTNWQPLQYKPKGPAQSQ